MTAFDLHIAMAIPGVKGKKKHTFYREENRSTGEVEKSEHFTAGQRVQSSENEDNFFSFFCLNGIFQKRKVIRKAKEEALDNTAIQCIPHPLLFILSFYVCVWMQCTCGVRRK